MTALALAPAKLYMFEMIATIPVVSMVRAQLESRSLIG
jgi:hypothetical protein